MGRDSSFIFLIGAMKMSDVLSGHGTWKSELEGRSPISSAWFLSIWVLITRTRPEEGTHHLKHGGVQLAEEREVLRSQLLAQATVTHPGLPPKLSSKKLGS